MLLRTNEERLLDYMSMEQPNWQRERRLKPFRDADDVRNNRIWQGINLVATEQNGVFTDLEKMVLLSTASLDAMDNYNEFAKKIEDARGEPMVLADIKPRAERGLDRLITIGTIGAPLQAKLSLHMGALFVKLENKEKWVNSTPTLIRASRDEKLFTFVRQTGAAESGQVIQQHQIMLIGRQAIKEDPVVKKRFEREVNTFYEHNP